MDPHPERVAVVQEELRPDVVHRGRRLGRVAHRLLRLLRLRRVLVALRGLGLPRLVAHRHDLQPRPLAVELALLEGVRELLEADLVDPRRQPARELVLVHVRERRRVLLDVQEPRLRRDHPVIRSRDHAPLRSVGVQELPEPRVVQLRVPLLVDRHALLHHRPQFGDSRLPVSELVGEERQGPELERGVHFPEARLLLLRPLSL
mmetsp:Transcript_2464/g.7653  ORF Transcript_2464/g.7653 Transcript_2464/m.7653 type:complete len:204 (+) Transcript_2464:1152-1763(+)